MNITARHCRMHFDLVIVYQDFALHGIPTLRALQDKPARKPKFISRGQSALVLPHRVPRKRARAMPPDQATHGLRRMGRPQDHKPFESGSASGVGLAVMERITCFRRHTAAFSGLSVITVTRGLPSLPSPGDTAVPVQHRHSLSA